ncbi:MAG: NAD(P)H-hydrate dehydratase [Lachnospiraceae bacterium]|nr:NAD(P)H-hydrate dehydratase [Lachnospiraceae bacterium]
MEYLLSAKQMKDCDAYTIHTLGVPSMVLMERAALAVVDEMKAARLDLSRVLIVCGSGNNGGDGFAVARILAERFAEEGAYRIGENCCALDGGMRTKAGRHISSPEASQGYRITLAFVGKETSMTEETACQKKICENCGIKPCTNFMDGEYTTIVDAIFGIGLSRKVEGRYAEIIDWINEQCANVVSVDIPSGIGSDDGCVYGTAVRADLTVTMAGRKIGQLLYPGAEYCGRLIRREIGIPIAKTPVYTYSDADLTRVPVRRKHSHKGTYGRVLLIAGSEGMCGAAVLAARSAFRSGCGMVRVFTPECNRTIIQTCLPEAMVTAWEPGRGKEDGLARLENAIAWADVIGIGPGLGTSGEAWPLLRSVLEQEQKPVVLDADALNLLSRNRDQALCAAMKLKDVRHLPPDQKAEKEKEYTHIFRDVPDSLRGKRIVTPHIGEMARLVREDASRITANLLDTAKTFAKEEQVVCVLKDARTVVTDGAESYLNTSGNDGMATAGSGDVLTGVICGLLAQGMSCFDAAKLGVYLHGHAGDLACEKFGACGMMAMDIANQIGAVMKMAHEKNDGIA